MEGFGDSDGRKDGIKDTEGLVDGGVIEGAGDGPVEGEVDISRASCSDTTFPSGSVEAASGMPSIQQGNAPSSTNSLVSTSKTITTSVISKSDSCMRLELLSSPSLPNRGSKSGQFRHRTVALYSTSRIGSPNSLKKVLWLTTFAS